MRTLSEIRAAFANFPASQVSPWLAGRRPLVLAPHPDDESLGCGGMIAAACAVGLHPVVIILTDGAASHPNSREFPPERLRSVREIEAVRAAASLGLPQQNLHFLQQPDTKLPSAGPACRALVAQIIAIGQRQDCGMIIGPWAGDPHCDHEAAAVLAASTAAETGWQLCSYPVWGWLRAGDEIFDEPRNRGWRLDIAAYQDAKQRAIAAHVSQYGGLITDSPDGFCLPAELLEVFRQPFEVFIA
jgi:LmbE family N-acetylglucosaminyl deacetylase